MNERIRSEGYNPLIPDEIYKSYNVDKDTIGFYGDIEGIAGWNTNYRLILYTTPRQQLVVMSLLPDEEIGFEIHDDGDQFFRIEEGSGTVIMQKSVYNVDSNLGTSTIYHKQEFRENILSFVDGDSFIVPSGIRHNLIAGENGLKLFTVYSPPQHPYDTIQKTKPFNGD